jgi:hypothetical protein
VVHPDEPEEEEDESLRAYQRRSRQIAKRGGARGRAPL